MSNANSATFSVNVMLNKENTKVLFMEANRDFADVLVSFLTLPLGKILKLLENEVIGSLSSLHKSSANLEAADFATESARQILLNPRASFALERRLPNLKLDLTKSQPSKVFRCMNDCSFKDWLYQTRCEPCGCWLEADAFYVVPDSGDDGCAFFTTREASFFIFDDLRIMTSSTGFLQTLETFGIGDINGSELKNFTFGFEQIVGLLKCCFISDTPLADLILNNNTETNPSSGLKQPEEGFLLNPKIDRTEGGISKSIILKVMKQKSTDKLLFAEAGDEFVELLFSFFIIPLGGVEYLLDNNTCLKSFDNLYRSILEGIDDEYFATRTTKDSLMNPNLPLGYASKDQFHPLREDTPPEGITNLVSPKGPGNFLKKGNKFMVGDDLTVTNHYMTSGISFLNRLNVPLSDVYEVEVKIGLEEALSILRASLTSTSALTHGLMMN